MAAQADNGWELSLSRYIDAPPATVWTIMTERQVEWWCPRPWRAEIIEQDWRAGGRCAMVMKGPNGEESPQEGVFLEVTPGVRFISTDAFRAGWVPTEAFMVGCWEIQAEGTGTRYTASARHWSKDACDSHAEMGFEAGWGACADQLVALAEAEAVA